MNIKLPIISHVLGLVLGKLDDCWDRFGQMVVMVKTHFISEYSDNLGTTICM